jgi:hypothetical protein
MVPVDLHKGSGSKGYYPHLALINSGATYNFISQSVTEKLRLKAAKAGRSKI